MKVMKMYEEFNFENTTNNILDELSRNIEYWFSQGVFSEENAEKINLDFSLTRNTTQYTTDPQVGMYRQLILDFTWNEYAYKVTIIIKLEDVEDDKVSKCHMKINMYNEEGDLIRRWHSEEPVDLNDIKDGNFIIDKIKEIQDKSGSVMGDENPRTLSPDDTDLDDDTLT